MACISGSWVSVNFNKAACDLSVALSSLESLFRWGLGVEKELGNVRLFFLFQQAGKWKETTYFCESCKEGEQKGEDGIKTAESPFLSI